VCFHVACARVFLACVLIIDRQVTALDLCPKPGTGVLRGDFLTVPIHPLSKDAATAADVSTPARTTAAGLASPAMSSSSSSKSTLNQTDTNGVAIGTYIEGRNNNENGRSSDGAGGPGGSSGGIDNSNNNNNSMPSAAALPEGGFDVVVRIEKFQHQKMSNHTKESDVRWTSIGMFIIVWRTGISLFHAT